MTNTPYRVERLQPPSGSPQEVADVLNALNENIDAIRGCSEIYLTQLDQTNKLDVHTRSWILSINKFIEACVAFCSEESEEVFGHNLRAIYEYTVRMMYYHHSGDIQRYENSFFHHPVKYASLPDRNITEAFLPEVGLREMARVLGFEQAHTITYDVLSKFSHGSFAVWKEFRSFYELLCTTRAILYSCRMFVRISIEQKPFSPQDWDFCKLEADINPDGFQVTVG